MFADIVVSGVRDSWGQANGCQALGDVLLLPHYMERNRGPEFVPSLQILFPLILLLRDCLLNATFQKGLS